MKHRSPIHTVAQYQEETGISLTMIATVARHNGLKVSHGKAMALLQGLISDVDGETAISVLRYSTKGQPAAQPEKKSPFTRICPMKERKPDLRYSWLLTEEEAEKVIECLKKGQRVVSICRRSPEDKVWPLYFSEPK